MSILRPFIEERLPEKISYGSEFRPRYNTIKSESGTGYTAVDSAWEYSLMLCDVSYAVNDQSILDLLINFFHAVKGARVGFRVKDFSDFRSVGASPGLSIGFEDQVILQSATQGQTEVQLIKNYIISSLTTVRIIQKPVIGTVLIGVNGGQLLSGWGVNTTTGLITFSTGLNAGDTVTAGYEFDVPMAFMKDELPIRLSAYKSGSSKVMLEEIRG